MEGGAQTWLRLDPGPVLPIRPGSAHYGGVNSPSSLPTTLHRALGMRGLS